MRILFIRHVEKDHFLSKNIWRQYCIPSVTIYVSINKVRIYTIQNINQFLTFTMSRTLQTNCFFILSRYIQKRTGPKNLFTDVNRLARIPSRIWYCIKCATCMGLKNLFMIVYVCASLISITVYSVVVVVKIL